MNQAIRTLLLACLCFSNLQADNFDRYVGSVISQCEGKPGVLPVKRITAADMAKHSGLIPEHGGVMVLIKTNSGNWGKFLVQFAVQKQGDKKLPMALVERLTTYKPGQERTIQAQASLVHLYQGFSLHHDLGQIVPESLGGDIRFSTENEGTIDAVGSARLFIVTLHLPGIETKKTGTKSTLGEAFDPISISGVYKLSDDGRRTATIELRVDKEGNITGNYTSEKTGQPYEVTGKVTPTLKHQIQFSVRFPKTEQQFTGWLFTKDISHLCGFSKLQGQEFGFFAVRME